MMMLSMCKWEVTVLQLNGLSISKGPRFLAELRPAVAVRSNHRGVVQWGHMHACTCSINAKFAHQTARMEWTINMPLRYAPC
jgi:hypothetical protein